MLLNNLSDVSCHAINSQLSSSRKLSKSTSSPSYKRSNKLLDQHMWATGTKMKIKLIGVQVANNRKAEKSGQV